MPDSAWLLPAQIFNTSAIALVFVLSWMVLWRHPEPYFRWWVYSSALAMIGGAASSLYLTIAPLRSLEFAIGVLMTYSSIALIACGRRYREADASWPLKWWLGLVPVAASWALLVAGLHSAVALTPSIAMLVASHVWFGWCFWPRRGEASTLGGRMLSVSSVGWGLHMVSYPVYTLLVPSGLPFGFWVSGMLQMGLSLGMIVHLYERSHERETALTRQLNQTNQELLRTVATLTATRSQAEVAEAIAREQEALVRQIIHDLRNATQAISLATEEIESAEGDGPRFRRGIAALDRQVRFISSFLKEKLAWIVDRSAPAGNRTELGAAVEAIQASYAPLFAARSQRFTVEPAPAVVLAISPVQFEQVVGNMLANAMAHCPPGTTIRLWTAVSDGWATCYVGDDGPGIPLAAQGRLGREAARADGTGVGLRNVQDLVTAAGGLFGLVSDAGAGATFSVTLPLVTWGKAGADRHAEAATLA